MVKACEVRRIAGTGQESCGPATTDGSPVERSVRSDGTRAAPDGLDSEIEIQSQSQRRLPAGCCDCQRASRESSVRAAGPPDAGHARRSVSGPLNREMGPGKLGAGGLAATASRDRNVIHFLLDSTRRAVLPFDLVSIFHAG